MSVPCYLSLFYHILKSKSTRRALHNHSILIMLFYNCLHITIDLSLTQNYTRLGYVSPFSPFVCLLWKYINFGIWYGGVYSILWTSFERHIFIFHSNLHRTKRQRLFYHYIPLILSSLYVPILYFYIIFISNCQQIYIETKIRCGSTCFYDQIRLWFDLYDSIINYILPIVFIVICNLTLILRFIKQKQRLKQAIRWRHCRKMVYQLILISTTHLIFDLPYIIIYIVEITISNQFANSIFSLYIVPLTYIPGLILPYAILLTLPALKYKIYNIVCFWKLNRRMIFPMTSKY